MDIQNDMSVAERLRAVRSSSQTVRILKSQSVAAKAQTVLENLSQDEQFSGATVDAVLGEVSRLVLTTPQGETYVVDVNESNGEVSVLSKHLIETSKPAFDVAEDVLKTATSAVHSLLDEDYSSSTPAFAQIARALDIEGDLSRRVSIEFGLSQIKKNRWYDRVVSEGVEADVEIPAAIISEDTKSSVSDSIDELLSLFNEHLEASSVAFESVDGGIETPVANVCSDVLSDVRSGVSALTTADRDDEGEMIRVYEHVVEQAPRLLKGALFITQLAHSCEQVNGEEK